MLQRYANRTLLEQKVEYVSGSHQIEITHTWSYIPSEHIDQEDTVLCLDLDEAAKMARQILDIHEKAAALKSVSIPFSKVRNTGGGHVAD